MRRTVQAKLTVLALAPLLPPVAGAACKFWRDLDQGRADAEGHMPAPAQVVARHFDEALSGQIENLEALASASSLDRIHARQRRR